MTAKDDISISEFFANIFFQLGDLPNIIRKSWKSSSEHYRSNFQLVYQSSGLSQYIDDYLEQVTRITLISFVTFFSVTLVLLILIRASILSIVLLPIATGLIISSIAGFAMISYPYYKRGEAKGRLEDGLVYFLSYMTVLSASGMSIERILDRISDVEDNPPLVNICKKFLMDVRLYGMDVRTALKDIAIISPSKILAKEIEGIRTTIATSGDLKTLLLYEVARQMQAKKEKLKSKLNTLVYIGELYVALMVITPTIFILIIAILSVLNGSTLGGSAVLQLNLIVFIGVPIMAAIFTVILDQTLGREE